MIPRGWLEPNFFWHFSYGWGKTPKKLQPGKLTRPGSIPGSLGERQRCYPYTTAVVVGHLVLVSHRHRGEWWIGISLAPTPNVHFFPSLVAYLSSPQFRAYTLRDIKFKCLDQMHVEETQITDQNTIQIHKSVVRRMSGLSPETTQDRTERTGAQSQDRD